MINYYFESVIPFSYYIEYVTPYVICESTSIDILLYPFHIISRFSLYMVFYILVNYIVSNNKINIIITSILFTIKKLTEV